VLKFLKNDEMSSRIRRAMATRCNGYLGIIIREPGAMCRCKL